MILHLNLYKTTFLKFIGYILEFLPPYSPDLNPIEHKWAQAKSIRSKKRCDINELFSYDISVQSPISHLVCQFILI